MKHKIDIYEKCRACDGTGIYVGIGERNGCGVVCSQCEGTGKHRFIHEYEDFSGRVDRNGITHVLEYNPGIIVGEIPGEISLSDFGGMDYADWKDGKPFPPKSEMRKFTCPAWWYQTADYKKKPSWPECACCGPFSRCSKFSEKSECWEKFDRENS